MGLAELVQFLEGEKESLLAGGAGVRDLYRSLSESLRTLPLLLRNSFAPESSLKSALDPQAQKILFSKPTLRSSEGEVQDNTSWLASLLNNLEVVRSRLLADPHLLEIPDLGDIRRVHADVRKFMEELYLQNSGWMLRDPNAEPAALARQKRKDVEELLSQHLDPFVERLEQLKLDEYSLRLRREIAEHFSGMEDYQKAPQAGEALIKEKCSRLGLGYDPELSRGVLQDLVLNDEALEARVRGKYVRQDGGQQAAKAGVAGLRQKYLRVVYRYLDRLREVSRLLPVLETIYAVFQPRPPLLERLARFFALLGGRQLKSPHRDVEFAYVIGRESIEHRRASLESLISEVNQLEKSLLRVKSSLASARAAKSVKAIPPARLRGVIDGTRASLRRIYDDGFGLVQWLGKKGNQERLSRVPDSSQRDLSACLETIYSTLIINSERLAEIDRRYPGQGLPEQKA
jgi:regulator of replication initiation timing